MSGGHGFNTGGEREPALQPAGHSCLEILHTLSPHAAMNLALIQSSASNPLSSPHKGCYHKMVAHPPPTFDSRLSMTAILEETLEPPTMAAKGRVGLEIAPSAVRQAPVMPRDAATQPASSSSSRQQQRRSRGATCRQRYMSSACPAGRRQWQGPSADATDSPLNTPIRHATPPETHPGSPAPSAAGSRRPWGTGRRRRRRWRRARGGRCQRRR